MKICFQGTEHRVVGSEISDNTIKLWTMRGTFEIRDAGPGGNDLYRLLQKYQEHFGDPNHQNKPKIEPQRRIKKDKKDLLQGLRDRIQDEVRREGKHRIELSTAEYDTPVGEESLSEEEIAERIQEDCRDAGIVFMENTRLYWSELKWTLIWEE